jgi:phage-related holin
MKHINNLLELAGFNDYNDFFGTFSSFLKPIFFISFSVASFVGFIETYSGISFMLWVFLMAGTLFDLALGWYTNVYYLDHPFESKKFFRGMFKSFVTLTFIFLTNFLKVGVHESIITPDYLKTLMIFMSAVMHYVIVFLIGLYLLLGVAENAAKLGIPVAKSIVKILRMRINTVEEMAGNKEV